MRGPVALTRDAGQGLLRYGVARTIAMDQFEKNEGLFIFAVGKLEDMLNKFKAHYYAEEFLA
jgi:hypothetical protein